MFGREFVTARYLSTYRVSFPAIHEAVTANRSMRIRSSPISECPARANLVCELTRYHFR
jgi:hypothetical protein